MANDHGAAAMDDPMDMAAHEETYAGFISLTEIAIIHLLSVILLLVLWGMEGHGVVALIGFIIATLAAAVGGLTGLGWRAGAPVFVLIGLACIVL